MFDWCETKDYSGIIPAAAYGSEVNIYGAQGTNDHGVDHIQLQMFFDGFA